MIELIIFIGIIVIGTILLMPNCKKTRSVTFVDEVIVKSPSCSSCSSSKQTKKFNLRPMGNEYDPSSPARLKIQAPDGQLSTFVTKPDHTNLQGRPWQDFHATSGESVYAPGVLTTWGLQNSTCNKGTPSFPVRNQTCTSGVVQRLAQLYYGKK